MEMIAAIALRRRRALQTLPFYFFGAPPRLSNRYIKETDRNPIFRDTCSNLPRATTKKGDGEMREVESPNRGPFNNERLWLISLFDEN